MRRLICVCSALLALGLVGCSDSGGVSKEDSVEGILKEAQKNNGSQQPGTWKPKSHSAKAPGNGNQAPGATAGG
jgi:hypothetical protein